MKKIYIYLMGIGLLGGCQSDFLDRTPYDSLSSETMWTTTDLTEKGVTGVYQTLHLGKGNTGRELYQLDAYGFTSQRRSPNELLLGTATSSLGMFSSIWTELYEGIHRANNAISQIEMVSPCTEEMKARYIAECKFLRAYYYSRLNQLWKGVPVYLEPVLDDEVIKGQESEAKVWEVIIQDLTDCINEPNLPDKYKTGDGSWGRATKGAAYALRGKAYMYIKDWAKAVADFSKVKDCGFSLFQGGYKALFKEANEQCDEMIFSIQYVGVENYGSTTQFYCGNRSSFGQCWNNYVVSPSLVDLYENIDGSPFDWNDVIPGYDDMTAAQREVYFLRDTVNLANEPAATRDFVRTSFRSKATSLNMSLYLKDGNEERVRKAYTGRDPRLEANVITPYATYLGREIEGQDRVFTYRWPLTTATEVPPTLDLRTDSPNQYFYLHRKFVYEGSSETPNRNYGPIDYPLIRYADVLLMWAEALTEQGSLEEAIALVNQIRDRAGVAQIQRSDASLPTYVSSQDDLRERVRNERRREFPNEGINFFDELRWNTWKEKVFEESKGSRHAWGGIITNYTFQGDYITTWAVPAVEVEKNKNLTPTPGWLY